MNKILICAILAGFMAGCTSTKTIEETSDFGMTRLEVSTPDGMKVKLDLGKEYSSFEGSLSWSEGKPVVDVRAIGVRAFEGQALAASVAMEVQRQLTERLHIGGEITADVVSAVVKAVLGSMILPGVPITM